MITFEGLVNTTKLYHMRKLCCTEFKVLRLVWPCKLIGDTIMGILAHNTFEGLVNITWLKLITLQLFCCPNLNHIRVMFVRPKYSLFPVLHKCIPFPTSSPQLNTRISGIWGHYSQVHSCPTGQMSVTTWGLNSWGMIRGLSSLHF